jgi:hypothetical protein
MSSSKFFVGFFCFLAILTGSACSDPKSVVLGAEPLKQMAEQGDTFKRLAESDRVLLAKYIAVNDMAKAFGRPSENQITGRTVGEVLVEAKKWETFQAEQAAIAVKREAEATALKQKTDAESKLLAEKISTSVIVAVLDKRVLPKNFDAGRYSEMLSISYALENKSTKTIKQLKGSVFFVDATGDAVGSLPVDFDQTILPGKTLKTDTGSGWKLNSFSNGDIEKIANREFTSMKASFVPTSIAFDDGEVIRSEASKR